MQESTLQAILDDMSIAEIEAMRDKNKDNEKSVVAYNNYLEARRLKDETNRAKTEFGKVAEGIRSKLPKPPIGTEMVDIHYHHTNEGVWVIAHKPLSTTIIGKGGSGKVGSGAHRINVKEVGTDNTVVDHGDFDTGVLACAKLGVEYGEGSAVKALRDKGYLVKYLRDA